MRTDSPPRRRNRSRGSTRVAPPYNSLHTTPSECLMSTTESCRARVPGFCRIVFALLLVWLCIGAVTLHAQQITLAKTSNAPDPVPSGQAFTYTLTYSWSGGPHSAITITD